MAEHKHADVLRAIADKGFQAAQFRATENDAAAWLPASDYCNPLTHPFFQWRIKPEPKPDMRLYYKVGKYDGDDRAASVQWSGDITSNLLLTFDGETGKLKSAEVLP